MLPPSRNLELKARDRDPARSLRTCRALGAEDRGLLLQQDTYFAVPDGRLKLRRESGAPAQLIAYERPDRTGTSESRYRIAEVADATQTEAVLASALGIEARVSKQRRLFLLGAVRIHLDLVVDLGSFIELEEITGRAPGEGIGVALARLRRAFGITDSDLVAESYGDLRSRSGRTKR